MNLTNDVRSKFSVFLFLEDIDNGADLRGHLAVSGYEVFMFRDQDTVIDRVKQAAPHLLVFEIEALQTPLSEFVELVLEANPEVQFVPLVTAVQAGALSEYREYNFASFVIKGEERDLRLLWQVDQVCSELYLGYQNEQLLDLKTGLEKQIETLKSEQKILSERNEILEAAETFNSSREIEQYEKANSKEEIMDLFLRSLEQKFMRRNQSLQALVLKFLPTVQSFVAVQSLGLELEKLRGIGARLEKNESENLMGFLQSGQLPAQLTQLVQQGLKVTSFVGKSLLLPDSVEALFVFWTQDGDINTVDFNNEYTLFQLVYSNRHLRHRLKESDTRDPITELEGREFYLEKIAEEVGRSRRLHKAVSVIKFSVDHFSEIEQAYGAGTCHSVLRTIAALVCKSSRLNDLSCRTDENEFSLILPHSGRKGAAIRAERIRRMIETHSFNLSGHRVTLSCGISEYPSLCASPEDLERTSIQALLFIQEKGGNKVCLYRAPQSFKPDFDVPPQ